MATESLLRQIAESIGAHRVPNRDIQERDRALQRSIVGLGLPSIWGLELLLGRLVGPPLWFALLGATYGFFAIAYRQFLRSVGEKAASFLLYAFLILDPIYLVGVLFFDAKVFAFLYPFLIVVIVRTGLRYGIRTMYLSWLTTLIASTVLPMNEFWRANVELSLSYLLMLAFVPLFFSSLIRRIHKVRAIEEERARSSALHELATARSAFLAKVSHELRSPLQGIVSALDVIELRHSRAFEGDEDLLARMRRSSMLLNAQLRDLLTLAKGEAGRLEMHPEPFEAYALVEAMMQSTRETATSKGLRLLIDLPPGPLFVSADGARIDQVLTNLVVNSIRYTDVGEVRVSSKTHQASQSAASGHSWSATDSPSTASRPGWPMPWASPTRRRTAA